MYNIYIYNIIYIYIYILSKQLTTVKDLEKLHNPAVCVQVKFVMGSWLDIMDGGQVNSFHIIQY